MRAARIKKAFKQAIESAPKPFFPDKALAIMLDQGMAVRNFKHNRRLLM